MLPRILVGQRDHDFQTYVEDFIRENPLFLSSQYRILPNAKNSITIDQIRELTRELTLKTIPRLIIVSQFELATLEAQNALLKTLEEKSTQHVFFLYVKRSGDILPTILSRCMLISFSQGNHDIRPETEHVIESLEKDQSSRFLSESVMQPSTSEDAAVLFGDIINGLQKRVRSGDMKAVQSVKIALELLSLLEHNNLNHQLALDSWYIRSKKIYRE